jgi:hypothetical protein
METNHALDFMVALIYFSVESKSNIGKKKNMMMMIDQWIRRF